MLGSLVPEEWVEAAEDLGARTLEVAALGLQFPLFVKRRGQQFCQAVSSPTLVGLHLAAVKG